MVNLIEIISDTVNFIRSARLVAEPLPKPCLEDVLVDSRANGDSNSATETAC